MDIQQFQKQLDQVTTWMQKEFQTIRTGQATPAILDGVTVETYGVQAPLSQIGSISVEGAKSLLISPYDKSQVKEIEKTLNDANLGLSIQGGDAGVRVIFPDLTAERREMLTKLAKEKLEKARVSVRHERDEFWSEIQKQEKDGDISEDEKFGLKEKMEEMVKQVNTRLEELLKNKEAEIKE